MRIGGNNLESNRVELVDVNCGECAVDLTEASRPKRPDPLVISE